MQIVSKAYKEAMKQQIRDESYVWVYLGAINKEAQANAEIQQDLYDISSKNVYGTETFEGYFATFEQNQCHVDGSMTLAPESVTVNPLYQGAVTDTLFGSITFTFGEFTGLEWKGLTIDFGEYYPTRFTVSNGNATYTHDNDSPHCVIDDVFLDTDYITITALEMVGGNQRLRIMSIMFGVGLVFDNNNLISTSRKNKVDHLSSSLPTKTFEWTADNRNHKFHVDDPDSYINFLVEEQDVEYEYGRKLYDENHQPYIYKIDGGTLRLKSWSSNWSTAKFTAVGYMDYLDGDYYKGQYHPEGITAYDAVMDILADAGIENYRIDEYLKKVIIHNAVPHDTHKNCLQLLANISRSVMYEDRQGRLVIDSSFVPDLIGISTDNESDWSNVSKILTDDDLINYATFEQDYCKVDDTMYLLPDVATQQNNNGYVSEHLFKSRNDNLTRRFGGRFGGEAFPFRSSDEYEVVGSGEASFEVEWEANWTFYRIDLEFGVVHPNKVRVHFFTSSEWVKSVDYDIEDNKTFLEDTFYEVNKLKIEFIDGNPNQRVHLQKATFGRLTDCEITFDDMAEKPTVTAVERVKQIDVHYYQYTKAEEEKKVETTLLKVGDNLLTYDDPYTDWRVEYTHKEEDDPEGGDPIDVTPTGDLTIVESGTFYVIVNSSIEADVDINAFEYEIGDNTYSYENALKGTTKTLENDLIDSVERAEELAEWLSEYYSSDADYSISYRGEPRIDCDDFVYVDCDFTTENLVRVEEEKLDTSTGMSLRCSVKGRRSSYKRRQ